MLRLLLICLLPAASFSQTIPYRQYREGSVLEYRLTSESFQNATFSGKSVAFAKMEVVSDSGQLAEEISWRAKTTYSGSDTTDLTPAARRVKPYRISLLPEGSVPLPTLDNPVMVGEITDLNTFFVAISPKLNMHKLSRRQPVYVNEKTLEGNFAEGISILRGSDCIQTSQRLVKHKKRYTVIQTDFMPPASRCITPLTDTIAQKTFDHPNNFQMLQKTAGGSLNLLWGTESFTVTCRIDNRDGKIISATMTNELNLRLRVNISPDLSSYAVEIPFKIKRNLLLEWIPPR
ncbi:MAG: hypothetical protein U0U70_08230 [Chitinophagaceae bacterium]